MTRLRLEKRNNVSDNSQSQATWQHRPTALSAYDEALDMSADAFGPLRDSTDAMHDPDRLCRQLAQDGYVLLRGFFDRSPIEDARRSLLRQLHEQGSLAPGSDPHEARANPGQPTGRALGNPLDQRDPKVRDIVFGPRMMSFFDSLFGEPAAHFDYIWYRTKGPGRGSAVHCDLVYMGRGTADLVTAWTPLSDIDLKLGGLTILEDSHKKSDRMQDYLSKDVDEYCSNHPDAAQYRSGEKWWNGTLTEHPALLRSELGGRWLTGEYEMGDLVLFSMTTVHGSLDNRTDRIRLSVDTRYQRASEPSDERWIGEAPVGHGLAMKRGRVC